MSGSAKNRIKNACFAVEAENDQKMWLPQRRGIRVALIAACVLMLSVAVCAATGIVSFYLEQNGDKVHVSAGLNSTVEDKTEELGTRMKMRS